MTDTPKLPTPVKKPPERVTLPNGEVILQYESGIQKNLHGRFLRGPTETAITRDPAGMNRRRYALAQQDARAAMDEAAAEQDGLDLSLAAPGYGWQAIIKHTVKTYLQSKNLRGMGETFGKLALATGYVVKEEEGGGMTDRERQAYHQLLEWLLPIAKGIDDAEREAVGGVVIDG